MKPGADFPNKGNRALRVFLGRYTRPFYVFTALVRISEQMALPAGQWTGIDQYLQAGFQVLLPSKQLDS
jgi:hypothetical protein